MATASPTPQQLENMATMMVADGIVNYLSGLGTNKDKRTHSHYGFVAPIAWQELSNMYRASWIAKQVVNAIPDDQTREWREFELGDEQSNAIKQLEAAEKALFVRNKVNEAMRWARLYGGSLIILGLRGVSNNAMAQPLNVETVGLGDLVHLQVVDRWRVNRSPEVTAQLGDPNFGKPEYYTLTAGYSNMTSQTKIHHTRVIRFDGEKLPHHTWNTNNMWDDSVLQHLYDSLRDYESTARSLASMVYEANVDVIRVKDLSNLLALRGGEDLAKQRWELATTLKSNTNTMLLDQNESYEKKGNSFVGLADILTRLANDISGGTGIAMTRLFGTSPGGLNATGDSDLENYYTRISAAQETELRPRLDCLDEVLVRSALGSIPDGYDYSFRPLWSLSEAEEATMELTRAQRDQIYMNSATVSPGVIAEDLRTRGTYSNLTPKDVQLARDLSEPMPATQQTQQTQPPAAPGTSGAKQ